MMKPCQARTKRGGWKRGSQEETERRRARDGEKIWRGGETEKKERERERERERDRSKSTRRKTSRDKEKIWRHRGIYIYMLVG